MNSRPEPVPGKYQSLVPYFAVVDAAALLEFVRVAFGAEPGETLRSPDGVIRHTEARIGDSWLMIGQSGSSRPNTTYMYVPDVDAVYRRAMSAPGVARSLREPTDEWYGDRSAGVEDSQGNQWWFAARMEDIPLEEMARRAAAAAR